MSPRPRYSRVAVRTTLAALLLTGAGAGAWWTRGRDPGGAPGSPGHERAAAPVLAIGTIADHTNGRLAGAGTALVDMLATNLARAQGLRVVRAARMYELLRQSGAGEQPDAGMVLAAARRAGATRVLDGAIYALPDGRYRLDLRQVDVHSGSVLGAFAVQGADLFALADSGMRDLTRQFGADAPGNSLADVTTHSLVAYRLYEEGLRAHVRGERAVAERLFGAALAEDSAFALAAYHHAVSYADSDRGETLRRFARAVRLAGQASDRERLTILAGWAATVLDPSLRAVAETLAARYPEEPEALLNHAYALVLDGDFLAAVPHYRRVVAMDGSALQTTSARCLACQALQQGTAAYVAADSLDAAERTAREWTALQPQAVTPWLVLSEVLQQRERFDEAAVALRRAGRDETDAAGEAGRPLGDAQTLLMIDLLTRAGRFAEAERAARALAGPTADGSAIDATWRLAIVLQQQGRFAEALRAARRSRSLFPPMPGPPGSAPTTAYGEIAVLWDAGQLRAAAALLDSVARWHVPEETPEGIARQRAWTLTHLAGVRAQRGDTAGLTALADSIERLGARSASGRDRRLHWHVRGLLLAARGADDAAIDAFRRALFTPTLGYTRTNLELARALLRRERPREAVAVLQPALRGALEGGNAYVSRTELHAQLARAFHAAGASDSARAHARRVAAAWRHADVEVRERFADVMRMAGR